MRESTLTSKVPDTDPKYIETRRESLKDVRHEVWGSGIVSLYDMDTRASERVNAEIESMSGTFSRIDEMYGFLEELERSQKKEAYKEMIQARRELVVNLEREKKERIYERFSDFMREMVAATREYFDTSKGQFLERELADMFYAEEWEEELKGYFGEEFEKFSPLNIYIKIINHELPADFLYRVAKRHTEQMAERVASAERLVEEYKQEFLQALQNGADQGWLPVDLDRAARRLELVKGRMIDQISRPRSGTLGNHSNDGVIGLSSIQFTQEKKDRLRKTIFHEFTHEIAGKSIQIQKVKDGDRVTNTRVHDRKQGVSFVPHDSLDHRYTWLNEAITEWLAVRLSGYSGDQDDSSFQGSYSYTAERVELDRLFRSGLEENTVLQAYFENIDRTIPLKEQGKHFAHLLKQVNAVEGDQLAFHRLENQSVLNNISYYLRSEYCYTSSTYKRVRSEFPPGTESYKLNVTIGHQADSTASIELYFHVLPDNDNDAELRLPSMQDRYRRVEKVINGTIRSQGARASFKIEKAA